VHDSVPIRLRPAIASAIRYFHPLSSS
jgi:hypothetical protein